MVGLTLAGLPRDGTAFGDYEGIALFVFAVFLLAGRFIGPNVRAIARALNPNLPSRGAFPDAGVLIAGVVSAIALPLMLGRFQSFEVFFIVTLECTLVVGVWLGLERIGEDLAQIAKAIDPESEATIETKQPGILDNIRIIRRNLDR